MIFSLLFEALLCVLSIVMPIPTIVIAYNSEHVNDSALFSMNLSQWLLGIGIMGLIIAILYIVFTARMVSMIIAYFDHEQERMDAGQPPSRTFEDMMKEDTYTDSIIVASSKLFDVCQILATLYTCIGLYYILGQQLSYEIIVAWINIITYQSRFLYKYICT